MLIAECSTQENSCDSITAVPDQSQPGAQALRSLVFLLPGILGRAYSPRLLDRHGVARASADSTHRRTRAPCRPTARRNRLGHRLRRWRIVSVAGAKS